MKFKIALSIIIATLTLGFSAIPASTAWWISPDIIETQVKPGTSSLPPVSIGNQSDQPADFKIELAGYGEKPDGSTEVLDQDSNPLTARPYIKFAPDEFHLNPGTKQQIDLNISIPPGTDGGRYAVLLVITSSASGSGGVSSVTRLGVPIRVAVSHSTLIKKGTAKIRDISGVETGKPITITTNYFNQGNVHYKVLSRLTITDARGDVLGKLQSETGLVLPGYTRDMVANWIPGNNLATGVYHVKTSVFEDGGALLSEATSTFQVDTLYIPPPTPAPSLNVALLGTIVGAAVLATIVIILVIYRRKAG